MEGDVKYCPGKAKQCRRWLTYAMKLPNFIKINSGMVHEVVGSEEHEEILDEESERLVKSFAEYVKCSLIRKQ